MASKQKTKEVGTKDYIFCEIVEVDGGEIVISASANIVEIAKLYQDKLMASRGIPIDVDNMTPRDPRWKVVAETMQWLKTNQQRADYLSKFYSSLADEARQESYLLAMFADKQNAFNNEPTPYNDDLSDLPGLEAEGLKNPKKNLANPLERRLRQIIDFVNMHSEKLQPVMDRLAATVNRVSENEADEDGFPVR